MADKVESPDQGNGVDEAVQEQEEGVEESHPNVDEASSKKKKKKKKKKKGWSADHHRSFVRVVSDS